MSIKKIIAYSIVSAALLLPLAPARTAQVAHAADTPSPLTGVTKDPLTGVTKPAADTPQPAGNEPLNIHLVNPLAGGGISTIPDAINKILSIVIRIALPLIIVFFIWSGLSFIFARGNPTAVAKAKNMFLFTVIGTLLILGAWVITNAIIGTVNAIIG